MTYILGLTGSIGTGKSTVSHMFKRLKVPIHDADKEVHHLYATDTSFYQAFLKDFPEYIQDNKINRQKVAQEAFQNPPFIEWLQEQIHPRIKERAYTFMNTHLKAKTPLIILDIPLLFETGYQEFCHGVMVTVCPFLLQQERVLARPGMTLEKFHHIISRQWPQEKKQQKATWLINTDARPVAVFQQIKELMRKTCQSTAPYPENNPKDRIA